MKYEFTRSVMTTIFSFIVITGEPDEPTRANLGRPERLRRGR
jgi:hypothetical protein